MVEAESWRILPDSSAQFYLFYVFDCELSAELLYSSVRDAHVAFPELKMSLTAVAVKSANRDGNGNQPLGETVNMVTNFKDAALSTQSIENFTLHDSKVGIMSFPCDFDHMYASIGDGVVSPKEKNECKHLKEICLQYLDLIQQQSDCIAQRDKQILSLRRENETLRQRLQRKDRRTAQHKCSSDLEFGDGDTISTRSHSRNTVRSPTSPRGSDAPKRSRSHNIGDLSSEGTCQSPLYWDEASSTRRDLSEDGGGSMSSGYEMRDDSSSTTASQFSRVRKAPYSTFASRGRKGRGKRSLSLCSKENSTRRGRAATASIDTPPPKRSKKAESEASSGSSFNLNSAVLTTSQPYYSATAGSDPVWSMQDLCPESEPETNGEILETPQWRTKVYSSLYSMEGTENLDDEVFLKRHQRLELDERRRKRWDVQRLREQRHIEKLKQRELAASHASLGTADESIGTLWPNPEDAQFLEVTDELPVGAFGLPVTKFTPSEFTLPWDHSTSREEINPSPKQVKRRRSAPAGSFRRKRIGRGGASRPSLSLHGRKSSYTERK